MFFKNAYVILDFTVWDTSALEHLDSQGIQARTFYLSQDFKTPITAII